MNNTKSVFIVTLLFTVFLTTVVVAQSTPKVRATTLEPARQAAYIFEFSFDSDVSPSSHIEIVFPAAFNLNTVIMAASEKIDGLLEVSSKKNSLILKRVKAQSVIPAGEVVDIKVASVLNPNIMSQDWTFKVIVSEGEREVEQKVLSTQIEQLTKVTR